MTPININIIDRIIDAVYNKHDVLLTRQEFAIDSYESLKLYKFDSGGKDAVYNVVITVNGKEFKISLHKTDDLDTVMEKQVKEQSK